MTCPTIDVACGTAASDAASPAASHRGAAGRRPTAPRSGVFWCPGTGGIRRVGQALARSQGPDQQGNMDDCW